MIGGNQHVIPDLAEPITAWRCWIVGGDEATPILRSPKSGTSWPPVGEWDSKVIRDPDRNFISAKCDERFRPNPNVSCLHCPSPTSANHHGVGCGIYGYKTIGDLAWDFSPPGLSRYDSTGQSGWHFIVWGKVLLWGSVYEHDHGYRAEFARIEEIVLVRGLSFRIGMDRIKQLAEFYSVPITMMPESTRLEIEDYFIERSVEESQKVATAMQKFGADMTKAFERMVIEMKKFATAFKTVAAELEKLSQTIDREDEDDG
jgi:hypothetical protein